MRWGQPDQVSTWASSTIIWLLCWKAAELWWRMQPCRHPNQGRKATMAAVLGVGRAVAAEFACALQQAGHGRKKGRATMPVCITPQWLLR